jgi:purine-binding chemotaxis protein CheW
MTVHVRFRVGAEAYAVPVEQVLEVAEIGELAPVPGAPETVLGVRNLRGQVLPVVDLATLFGLEHELPAGRLVIVEAQGKRAGLAIDEVTDVGDLTGPVQESESELLAGSTLIGSELVGVVDVERVYAAIERRVSAA